MVFSGLGLFENRARDDKPLVFTDSQRTDDFLEIELGSEDVLSQLDSIMQGNAERRNRL